jgi:hypothetical protein
VSERGWVFHLMIPEHRTEDLALVRDGTDRVQELVEC